MDRGVSGEYLSASDCDVEKDPFPARHVAMDPDRLPFPTPAAAKDPRLLEPQGIDFKSWREEEGVLRLAAVVSRKALKQATKRHKSHKNYLELFVLFCG